MAGLEFTFNVICKLAIYSTLLFGFAFLTQTFLRSPKEKLRFMQFAIAFFILGWLLVSLPNFPKVSWKILPAKLEPKPNERISSIVTREATESPRTDNSETVAFRPTHLSEKNLSSLTPQRNGELPTKLQVPPASEPASKARFSSSRAAVPVATLPNESWSLLQVTQALVVCVFTIGLVWHVLTLILGKLLLRRLINRCCELPKEKQNLLNRAIFKNRSMSHKIRIIVSHDVVVPLATGLVRPTIIIPQSLIQRNQPHELNSAIAHEAEHLVQYDLWTWQCVNLTQCLVWFQPFFWLLKKEIRFNQDLIADNAACRKIENADYAQSLVNMAKSNRLSPFSDALTMSGTKSNLYRRVEMLLNQPLRNALDCREKVIFLVSTSLALCCIFLCSLQLTHVSASETPRPSLPQEDANKTPLNDPPEQELKPVKHRGLVVDSQTGLPIKGATVIITRMSSKTWTELGKTESQTSAIGAYSFEIPPAQLKDPYLYILVDLRHDTYAPRHCGSYSYSMIQKNLKLGDLPWFSKLKMQPGRKITGRLVDDRGKPVENAQVRVNSKAPGANNMSFDSYSSTKTKTDREGRFSAIITKDGTAGVSFIPVEHCMKHKTVTAKESDLGDIQVDRGFEVSGKVLDARGKPLKDLWVNMKPTGPGFQGENASYEMVRSCKSDENGNFKSRALTPGNYTIIVETKATGAIEKLEYANFKDNPPPAAFVRQSLEITKASAKSPIVIQAVPHIMVTGRGINSKGEPRSIHIPDVMGRLDDQLVWIRGQKGKGKGEFKLMVPHGLTNARLNISTNEHSALLVQLGPEAKQTTETSFEFEKMEEDILDIVVTRFVAPILQVKVVDEDGNHLKNAAVGVIYDGEGKPNPRLIGIKTHVFFEKQTNGLRRSSSLVPGKKLKVFAELKGYKSENLTLNLKEGEEKQVEIRMSKSDKTAPPKSAKMKMEKDKSSN